MSATPVAFDIKTNSAANLASLPKVVPALDPAITPARSTVAPKVQARVDLLAIYASVLGVRVLPADLLDSLQNAAPGIGSASGNISIHTMQAALAASGLDTQITPVSATEPQLWPAIASMVSGQFLLVLSQDADVLTIYDPSCTEDRAEVSLREFEPFFSGILLQAQPSVMQLDKAHGAASAQPHWFWGEFPKYRRQLAEVALGSLVANLLAVAVALFSLQVYDRVIPHQSVATLWVLALGALLAIVMEAMLKMARSHLVDGAGRSIELSVQKLLMARLLAMQSGKRPNSPSGLFSAMREFGSVREFFTASSIGTLTDLPFLIVFLLLVASIAGNVVWILVLGGILMVLPGYFMQKKMMRLTQETQGASARSSRLLHEVIFEQETLKSQRAEDRFARLWGELTALSALKSSEQRQIASALTFWSQGVQQTTYIMAVVVGTYMVFAGEFTVGTIIAVGILTSRTLAPLTQLAGTMARWSNVKGALVGLDAIAAAEMDHDPARTYLRRDTLDGGFELRGLEFRYDPDGPPTLDIAGLVIKPGQRIAVLGANGSGKSTLLKLLSGLYAPTAGRVLIDGVDMAQLETKDIRRNVGYLSQDVRLFTGTLRNNLAMNMLEIDDEHLFRALDFAGIGQYVRGHHKGLDLEIRDGGEGLSIGQRQSIGWARLWLQDPRVVLLDEPTAALDQTLENTLVSRLNTWLSGRTAVIATHRVPILSLTERTCILQNGRLTVDGPRDAVLAHLTKAKEGGRADGHP